MVRILTRTNQQSYLLSSWFRCCRFDELTVTGSHVDDSMTKGMCVAPLMWTAGWKSLCVSADGGTNFDYCADIHIGKCFYSYLYRHHDDSPGSIFSRLTTSFSICHARIAM